MLGFLELWCLFSVRVVRVISGMNQKRRRVNMKISVSKFSFHVGLLGITVLLAVTGVLATTNKIDVDIFLTKLFSIVVLLFVAVWLMWHLNRKEKK
jgi:ABC-type nickel/cobalt efflux system permease component RcnA